MASYASSLGFAPLLEFHGQPELDDAQLREDLLAVVREALANVSRHAEAHAATVVITVGATLRVEVTDDGIGLAGMAAAVGWPTWLSARRRVAALSGWRPLSRPGPGSPGRCP